MLEDGKISSRQFMILVFLFTIGSSVLILPAGLAQAAKQDSWIGAAAGLAAGLLLVVFYNSIGKLFKGVNFTQFNERVFGKWLGKTVLLLLFGFTFTLAALVLRNLGDFLENEILPESPIQFVELLFILIVAIGVRLGIEVIARTAEIFLPWVLLLFTFVIVMIVPEMELPKIQPVFEGGIKTVTRAAISVTGTPYLELVVFLLVFPYLNRTKQTGKAFLIGTFVGGIVLVAFTFICILVLGADVTARQTYPTYVLAKKISIGDILERMEVLVAGSWFLTMFFKLTICFYCSVIGLAQLLKLTDYRPLIFPLAMILITYSIVAYPNTSYFLDFATKIWPYFAATFGLLLPLLIFTTAKLRGYR